MKNKVKIEKKKELNQFDLLENSIKEFIKIRQNPLLILYWSNTDGEIVDFDVTLLEKTLQDYCEKSNIKRIEELDIIIYTRGGQINASYLVAQTIKGYVKKVNMFVPKHAYSGGTMIALCSDIIFMGIGSRLSPIDIQLGGKMALIDIEKYVEFISHSCDIAELEDERAKSPVLIELLKELISKVNPLQLGDFFRLRNLSEYYAKILLIDYMFKEETQRIKKAENAIKRLTSDSPTHGLDMDINIIKGIGLNAKLMDNKLYKLGNLILDYCFMLEKGREGICEYPSRECEIRMPFFQIFDEKEVK